MLWFNWMAFSGFSVILRSVWISEETDLFWLCIICLREELFFSVCQKWNTMCQTFYIPDFLCWKCLFGAALVSCKKFCNMHFDLFYLITVSATSWLLKLLQWIFRRQFFILKLFIPVRRQYVGIGNITIQSPRLTITKAVKIVSGCTGTMQFYQRRRWDRSRVSPQHSHCPKEEHVEEVVHKYPLFCKWLSYILPRMTLLLAHHQSKKGLKIFCHH